MPNFPKFEDKIKHQMGRVVDSQGTRATYGIILDFDQAKNTATVLVSHPGSNDSGETYYNVPCPVSLGIQGVAPTLGRPCWVGFKDGTTWFPIVVSFFNHVYEDIDHPRQNASVNNTPRFMYNM